MTRVAKKIILACLFLYLPFHSGGDVRRSEDQAIRRDNHAAAGAFGELDADGGGPGFRQDVGKAFLNGFQIPAAVRSFFIIHIRPPALGMGAPWQECENQA